MTRSPLKSRFEQLLRGLPVPALRDIVVKRPSQGANLDALDGIRGLAVLLVIASHSGGLHLEGQGGVGVFLFFALSAFLLTMPFASRPDPVWDPARLRRYGSRRIRRILPLYYSVILFSFLARDDAGLGFLWRHLLFLRGDGIYWTIPQEMLFYCLLPLLAVAHPFLFRRHAIASAIGFGALAWLCNGHLDASVFALDGNGKSLRFYLGIFATGMAFCYALHSPELTRIAARPAINRLLGWLGLAILALFFVGAPYHHLSLLNQLPLVGPFFASLHPKMGLYYKGTFGLLCGSLIYITLVCRARPVHRILSSLTLRALGITSYSLYLLHIIVRDKLIELGVGLGNGLFLLTLSLSYLLACFLYAAIERPFMRVQTRGG